MTEIKIKKCPPGRAYGADDLRKWAKQRMSGGSGVPISKRARKFAKARSEAQDKTAQWLRQAERKARKDQN